MQINTDPLDFVTIEGLLVYGEQFARRPSNDEVLLPAAPASPRASAHLPQSHLTVFQGLVQTYFSDKVKRETYLVKRVRCRASMIIPMLLP